MSRPSLAVNWREVNDQTLALQKLIGSLVALSPAHQKLVAEVVMVRLFLLLDNTFRSSSAKLLCGAQYLDASQPKRLVQASSAARAIKLMKTHNRAKPKYKLSWTHANAITNNLLTTLDSSDPFFGAVTQHSAIIDQMRRVRNHIAHRNDGTGNEFRIEVTTRFGGAKRGMTPGLFLLLPTAQSQHKIDEYLIASRVIVRDVLRA